MTGHVFTQMFGGQILGALANHLWQSTVFAAGAALLALALRKNRAPVRYWVWLAASAKFLIPFSAFAGIGGALSELLLTHRIAAVIPAPATALAVDQIAEPFRNTFSVTNAVAAPAPHATHWPPIVIFCAWACGFVAVVAMRIRGWLRVRAALRASTPMDLRNLGLPAVAGTAETTRSCFRPEVCSCPGLLEPGVVGFWRPVLLLPEGIAENLSPEQLAAVLAHELSHIRRRDNLTALIQMIVEAIFWFYPVVWWIGARLVEERERACDEAVLATGGAPRDYADAILSVCKMYVESPVECVAGISGSDLKKRVVRIMMRSLGEKLTPARKLLVAAAALAAIAAPVVFGLTNAGAPQDETVARAQEAAAALGPEFKYDVVSIKLNKAADARFAGRDLPDGLTLRDIPLQVLFLTAYGNLRADQIIGAPDWWDSWKYDVEAKTDGPVANELRNMNPDRRRLARQHMMQELLANRFKLKVHWETRRLPVYFLTVAKGGPKFKEAPPREDYGWFNNGNGRQPLSNTVGVMQPGKAKFNGASMDRVVGFLERGLGREVIDRTELTGHYDFVLQWAPTEQEIIQMEGPEATARAAKAPAAPNGPPALAPPSPYGYGPVSAKSVEKQLGLHLEGATGPVPVIVIDHIEKPTEN